MILRCGRGSRLVEGSRWTPPLQWPRNRCLPVSGLAPAVGTKTREELFEAVAILASRPLGAFGEVAKTIASLSLSPDCYSYSKTLWQKVWKLRVEPFHVFLSTEPPLRSKHLPN